MKDKEIRKARRKEYLKLYQQNLIAKKEEEKKKQKVYQDVYKKIRKNGY